jgi:endonuclease/exonuclease/phosphatase family metal-dependent hydrolase
VANVHLDERSPERRAASADQLAGWVDEAFSGLPVVVMGDFNATAASDELAPLRVAGLTPVVGEGGVGTSHGFGRHHPRPIDNIWLSDGWSLHHMEVVERAGMASDHLPVVATLSLA